MVQFMGGDRPGWTKVLDPWDIFDLGVEAPKQSLAQKALVEAQTRYTNMMADLTQRTAEQNRTLLPFLAQQEGFDVDIDPTTGMVTGIRERPSPEREQEREIQRLFRERSLAALKGELPVDPALERSLKEEEAEIRNRLASQFGPGYETSGPAIETLSKFFESAEVLRSGARTGQLTLAEQLGLTREQQEMFRRGTAQDVFRQYAVSDPMAYAGAFGQVAQGYQQAQVPYLQQQQLKMGADVANQQLFGQFVGAAGKMATAGM
jgi:hypothetical protein